MKFRFSQNSSLLVAHIWAFQVMGIPYDAISIRADENVLLLEVSPPASFNYFEFGCIVANCETVIKAMHLIVLKSKG